MRNTEEVAENPASYTGKYVKKISGRRNRGKHQRKKYKEENIKERKAHEKGM